MTPILEVRNLKTHFPIHGGVLRRVQGHVKAVNGVSLKVFPQQILSIVGESGCGKSTLGQSMLGLNRPTSGEILLDNQSLPIHQASSWKPFRRQFQFIFQDPYSSLNPRHTIFEILSEPLWVHQICPKSEFKDRVAYLLQKVGLDPDYMHRFPHAFSGGQRQRINIARVLGIQPKLIICDEIVAALDVSVQAQIIHLLLDLKKEFDLSLVFISHDLSLVHAISDQVAVMYLGQVVECASTQDLFKAPQHPYTQALIDSIPTLDLSKRPKRLSGEVPSPQNLPQGCAFQSRCAHAQERCSEKPPALEGTSHQVACWFPRNVT